MTRPLLSEEGVAACGSALFGARVPTRLANLAGGGPTKRVEHGIVTRRESTEHLDLDAEAFARVGPNDDRAGVWRP